MSHINPSKIKLDDFLKYNQNRPCSQIDWDLKDPPSSVRLAKNDKPIATSRLSVYATNPPLCVLTILCELFPDPLLLRVYNSQGVTVLDVLEAISRAGKERIAYSEVKKLSEKQRQRIEELRDPWRANINRADCLMHTTKFAGLSIAPFQEEEFEEEFVFMLTLSRPRGSRSGLKRGSSLTLSRSRSRGLY